MRLTALSLAMFLASQLPGCAAEPYGWSNNLVAAPLPGVIVPATLEQIQAKCPHTPGAIGCAERDFKHNVCIVYAPKDAPVWLLEHEALHCMGYNHARS